MGTELQRLRHKTQLTQKALAAATGASAGAIGRYETDDLMPGKETLATLLVALGADAETQRRLERTRQRGAGAQSAASRVAQLEREVREMREQLSGMSGRLDEALEALKRRRPPRG